MLDCRTVSIALISALGADVERSWHEVDNEPSAFPRICAEHLEAARLHERVAPEDIVAAALAANLPEQRDPAGRFGQPPVTLFRARRFYIDALFWVDATTTVHDHAFSGAFQVLSGRSIETNFTFVISRGVGGHLHLGDLRAEASILRRTGEVRPILAGPSYVHSLFHLDRPSVSLVVRTYSDSAQRMQLEYSAGIAFDPFLEDPIRDRMIQVVDMLRRTENPEFEDRVGELIATTDLHTAFSVIRSCAKLADVALLDRLIARVRDQTIVTQIRVWVDRRRREDLLMSRRGSVVEPSLRFLLAVLLNARRRVDALALVASHSGEPDPARTLAGWLCQLSKTTVRLQLGNVPFEPNVLGLPPFGPGCEQALADVLAGRRVSRDSEVDAFLGRLRALPPLEPLFVE
jgi:hypothetical protein